MNSTRSVAKTYRKFKLSQQPRDFAYWQDQPPQARLMALEDIRREYHRWAYGTEPRFQRVYRITKLK